MKKLRYVALLLIAAFVLSGCNIVKVNPERDGAQIVAEVNGENITKKQVYDQANIEWGQKVEAWDLEEYKQKKEEALDGMIQDIVVKQKVKELGYYSFTADEQKQIDDALDSFIKTTYDDALAKYKKDSEADSSINPEEKANADVDAFLAGYGYTRESYKLSQADDLAYDKAKKVVTDPITPSDADVKTGYDELLEEQKTQFDADAAQMSMYEMYGYPILYYPAEGYVRVKHILITIPDDARDSISALRKEGKNDDADKKLDEELKKIEATANEALTKAKAAAGDTAKLNQLIKDYGKDPGMTEDNPGYMVYKDSKDWMPEFTEAAMNLKELAKPSDLVATDYGYHILWLTEKIAKGDVPLENVKDKMTEIVKASKQNEAWQAEITKWMDEYKTKIVKHLDRLHN